MLEFAGYETAIADSEGALTSLGLLGASGLGNQAFGLGHTAISSPIGENARFTSEWGFPPSELVNLDIAANLHDTLGENLLSDVGETLRDRDSLLGIAVDIAPYVGDLTETTIVTITAAANGDQAPPTTMRPETVINGDFEISSNNERAPVVGDGLDERTWWTFDFTQDPEVLAFERAESITTAILTLELSPRLGVATDTTGIEALGYVVSSEIRNLPLLEVSTVTIDLLDTYTSEEIIGALEKEEFGKFRMYYDDDAIVSFASLELTGSIPVDSPSSDFSGDGKDDVFIRSPEWAGLLSFDGTNFRQLSLQHDWIDGWNLSGIDQHFVGRLTKDFRPKALWADTTGTYGEYGVIPALNDVAATFSRASGSKDKRHKFFFNPRDFSINRQEPDDYSVRDHIQSVARISGEGSENLLAFSRHARDVGDAALYVARFNGIQSDGDAWKWASSRTSDSASDYFYYRFDGVNHAGGIQALGSMVFVAADNDNGATDNAYIQVLDLRNLQDLIRPDSERYVNRLVIDGTRNELIFPVSGEQISSRAAAVAAVRLQSGNHLLFVRRGTPGDRFGWFFVSDSPNIETANWHLLDFWERDDLPNGTPWHEWETINFVPESETGDIYMIAMGMRDNKSFLYRLSERIEPFTGHRDLSFEYIAGRGLNTSNTFIRTRFGAGIHITPNRNIVSYVTDRKPNPRLRINEFRYHND